MTDTVTLVPRAEDRAVIGEAVAIARACKLRLDAYHQLMEASRIPFLPEIVRQQLQAAARLAGATFHRVKGPPTPTDCEAMARDLRNLPRIIDPLIAAIGEAAITDLGMSIKERKLFADQLLGALDGNATYVLEEELPEQMREDHDEDRRTSRHNPRE